MSGLGPIPLLTQAERDSRERLAIWQKGAVIPGYDAREWRYDFEGFAIRWSDYGNTASKHGWQRDHIHPFVLGGADHISNFRPRHWRANQSAGGALSGLGLINS